MNKTFLITFPLSLIVLSGTNPPEDAADLHVSQSDWTVVNKKQNPSSTIVFEMPESTADSAIETNLDVFRRIEFLSALIHQAVLKAMGANSESTIFFDLLEKLVLNAEFGIAAKYYFERADIDCEEKLAFIDLVLSSGVNYFNGWFKAILLLGSKTKDRTLSFVSKDILAYYKLSFDRIGI